MHPALAALSPRQASALFDDPEALAAWLCQHRLPYREAIAVIGERMLDDEAAPPVVRPNRRDAAELLAFVERAARLPARLRAVAALCLRDGATLDEAAARPRLHNAAVTHWVTTSCPPVRSVARH